MSEIESIGEAEVKKEMQRAYSKLERNIEKIFFKILIKLYDLEIYKKGQGFRNEKTSFNLLENILFMLNPRKTKKTQLLELLINKNDFYIESLRSIIYFCVRNSHEHLLNYMDSIHDKNDARLTEKNFDLIEKDINDFFMNKISESNFLKQTIKHLDLKKFSFIRQKNETTQSNDNSKVKDKRDEKMFKYDDDFDNETKPTLEEVIKFIHSGFLHKIFRLIFIVKKFPHLSMKSEQSLLNEYFFSIFKILHYFSRSSPFISNFFMNKKLTNFLFSDSNYFKTVELNNMVYDFYTSIFRECSNQDYKFNVHPFVENIFSKKLIQIESVLMNTKSPLLENIKYLRLFSSAFKVQYKSGQKQLSETIYPFLSKILDSKNKGFYNLIFLRLKSIKLFKSNFKLTEATNFLEVIFLEYDFLKYLLQILLYISDDTFVTLISFTQIVNNQDNEIVIKKGESLKPINVKVDKNNKLKIKIGDVTKPTEKQILIQDFFVIFIKNYKEILENQELPPKLRMLIISLYTKLNIIYTYRVCKNLTEFNFINKDLDIPPQINYDYTIDTPKTTIIDLNTFEDLFYKFRSTFLSKLKFFFDYFKNAVVIPNLNLIYNIMLNRHYFGEKEYKFKYVSYIAVLTFLRNFQFFFEKLKLIGFENFTQLYEDNFILSENKTNIKKDIDYVLSCINHDIQEMENKNFSLSRVKYSMIKMPFYISKLKFLDQSHNDFKLKYTENLKEFIKINQNFFKNTSKSKKFTEIVHSFSYDRNQDKDYTKSFIFELLSDQSKNLILKKLFKYSMNKLNFPDEFFYSESGNTIIQQLIFFLRVNPRILQNSISQESDTSLKIIVEFLIKKSLPYLIQLIFIECNVLQSNSHASSYENFCTILTFLKFLAENNNKFFQSLIFDIEIKFEAADKIVDGKVVKAEKKIGEINISTKKKK